MAEKHLKIATAVTVLVGCAACTIAPAQQNPTDPSDPSATATPDPGPTAPTREEAEGIIADYDDRNNAAIALTAKWKAADGGVLLSRDTYTDRLKAREAKNNGTKVKAGQPITTQLIDVLGWSSDGDTQTLIVTNTFATAPQVSVFVKRGDAPWRKWVGVYFPSTAKLPKPADASEQTVKDAAKAQVKAINTYRTKGTKPSGATLDSTYAKYFAVLKGGNSVPGFVTERTCATSTDEGVSSAWQVPTASGTLSLVANRCDELAKVTRSGYWLTWNWSDDKIFGIAGKKLSSYQCELSGPTVTIAKDGKQRWYGSGWYRLGKCDMKRL